MENNLKKFKGLSESQSAQLNTVIEYLKASGYDKPVFTNKAHELVVEVSKPGINVSVTFKKRGS